MQIDNGEMYLPNIPVPDLGEPKRLSQGPDD